MLHLGDKGLAVRPLIHETFAHVSLSKCDAVFASQKHEDQQLWVNFCPIFQFTNGIGWSSFVTEVVMREVLTS